MSKNKVGRPKREFDNNEVKELEKLASMMCTKEEAAAFFDMSKKTFIDRLKDPIYEEIWERGQSKGKATLRRAQFKTAMKGNASMQIWLGKQWLNQTDQLKQITDSNSLILQFIEAAKDGFIPLKIEQETIE